MCLLTNVDATNVPKPFVKWSAEPAIASEVPAVLARAIHIANTAPRGPVFVSLPMDDMAVELTDKQSSDIDVVRTRTVTHAGGFPDELAADIATRLDDATSPAIIVGGDVERFGAWDAVIALAERTRSIVLTAPLTGLSGLPGRPPALPRIAPTAALAGFRRRSPAGTSSRHRRTGVPVLPQDPGPLSARGHQPDPHHQRPRRGRPRTGRRRDRRRPAVRRRSRAGPCRPDQQERASAAATRSTTRAGDGAVGTGALWSTVGLNLPDGHPAGHRGRQQRIPDRRTASGPAHRSPTSPPPAAASASACPPRSVRSSPHPIARGGRHGRRLDALRHYVAVDRRTPTGSR